MKAMTFLKLFPTKVEERDKLEAKIAVIASLVVMFSALWSPIISLSIAIVFLIWLSLYKLLLIRIKK